MKSPINQIFNTYFYLFVGLCFLLFMTACTSQKDTGQIYWGKATTYGDFWFNKTKEVHMTKKLHLDFNDNARQDCSAIQLQLCEKDENGNYLQVHKGLALYQDSMACADHIITLHPNCQSTTIDLVAAHDLADGYHVLCLKVLENGQLDRIGDTSLADNDIVLDMNWKVKKASMWNPLKTGLSSTGIIIFAGLLAWILIFAPLIYDNIQAKRVHVQYADGKAQNIRCYNAHRVFFTSKPVKDQNFVSRWFTGKRLYRSHGFWSDNEVCYISRRGNRKDVTLHCSRDFSPRNTTLSKNRPEATITNKKSNEIITIKIQN